MWFSEVEIVHRKLMIYLMLLHAATIVKSLLKYCPALILMLYKMCASKCVGMQSPRCEVRCGILKMDVKTAITEL